MIDRLIAAYLQTHNRLTIPGFGSFVRRADTGQLLFSGMFRADDGVLCRLLVEEGIAPSDAARRIETFVAEIRRRCAEEGRYPFEGIGSLTADPDGLFRLEDDRDLPPVVPDLLTARIPAPKPDVATFPRLHPENATGLSSAVPATKTPPNASRIADDPLRLPDIAPRRRIDRVMLIAIVAAVLAVGALIYGILMTPEITPVDSLDEPVAAEQVEVPQAASQSES